MYSTADLTNEELDCIATVVGRDWERVATHLGIDPSEVDTLKKQPCSLYQKAFLSLHRWTQDCVDPCCRVVLTEKLKEAGFGRLAKRIRTTVSV